jgi:prophage regulatory protein
MLTMNQQKRLIRRADLRRKVPLSDSHIYELEKAGKFPARIQLTPRCVAWDEAEVDSWIEARKADAETAKAPIPDVRKRKSNPVAREVV